VKKEIKFLKYRLFCMNMLFITVYAVNSIKYIIDNVDKIFSLSTVFLIILFSIMVFCSVKLFNNNIIFNIVKHDIYNISDIFITDVTLSIISIIIILTVKFLLNLFGNTDTSIYYSSTKTFIIWLALFLIPIVKYKVNDDYVKYKKVGLIKTTPYTSNNEITEYLFLNEEEYNTCIDFRNKQEVENYLGVNEYYKPYYLSRIEAIIPNNCKEIIIYAPDLLSVPYYIKQYCNKYNIIINVQYYTMIYKGTTYTTVDNIYKENIINSYDYSDYLDELESKYSD